MVAVIALLEPGILDFFDHVTSPALGAVTAGKRFRLGSKQPFQGFSGEGIDRLTADSLDEVHRQGAIASIIAGVTSLHKLVQRIPIVVTLIGFALEVGIGKTATGRAAGLGVIGCGHGFAHP